jgi:hypothetical protein
MTSARPDVEGNVDDDKDDDDDLFFCEEAAAAIIPSRWNAVNAPPVVETTSEVDDFFPSLDDDDHNGSPSNVGFVSPMSCFLGSESDLPELDLVPLRTSSTSPSYLKF